MNEEQGEERPEEEERVELAQDLVILEISGVEHACRCERQHEAGVDEVGGRQEHDEDGGGVGPHGGGAQEDIQGHTVEDRPQAGDDGSGGASHKELVLGEHSRG